ncbi:MAG: hypothetical protein OHK006_23860 [Thermodesulfovibrionales bacterium]
MICFGSKKKSPSETSTLCIPPLPAVAVNVFFPGKSACERPAQTIMPLAGHDQVVIPAGEGATVAIDIKIQLFEEDT